MASKLSPMSTAVLFGSRIGHQIRASNIVPTKVYVVGRLPYPTSCGCEERALPGPSSSFLNARFFNTWDVEQRTHQNIYESTSNRSLPAAGWRLSYAAARPPVPYSGGANLATACKSTYCCYLSLTSTGLDVHLWKPAFSLASELAAAARVC